MPLPAVLDSVCISGKAIGHKDLSCRDGNSMDCNNQGSCAAGKCACTGGYSGASCQFVPAEKCKIKAGQCLTGSQIGGEQALERSSVSSIFRVAATSSCCFHLNRRLPCSTRLRS